jgi:hypothetical protein
MVNFLGFLSLLGWSCFSARVFVRNAIYAPIFTVSSLVTLLFFMGLLGVLGVGSKILFICGLVLLPIECFDTKKLRPAKSFLNYGIIVFSIVGLLWFYWTRNGGIIGWDDFFWAVHAKVVKLTDALWNGDSGILRNGLTSGYPPGMALFQYYFMTFGGLEESSYAFGHGLFLVVGLLCLLGISNEEVKGKKEWAKHLLGSGLCVFASLYLFSQFSLNPGAISGDDVLGALFGAGLIYTIFNLETRNDVLVLLPILVTIGLIKVTGPAFSAVVAASAIIGFFFRGSDIRKSLMILLPALGLATILPKKLWDLYLSMNGLSPPSSELTISQIVDNMIIHPTTRSQLTFPGFTWVFKNRPFAEGAAVTDKIAQKLAPIFQNTGLGWLILLASLLVIALVFAPVRIRLSRLAQGFWICFGVIPYSILLLVAYVFFLPEWEGIYIAGFARYMGSYFLGIGLVAIAAIRTMNFHSKISRAVCGLCILIFVLMLNIQPSRWDVYFEKTESMSSTSGHLRRVLREKILPPVFEKTPENSTIYVIFQKPEGNERLITMYELSPRKMNAWFFSLGKKSPEGNGIWGVDWTVDEFSNALLSQCVQLDTVKWPVLNPFNYTMKEYCEKYDYLLLARTDEEFWQRYSSLFPKGARTRSTTLYKIGSTNTGSLELTPLN